MKLSRQDSDLYFKLMWSLQFYINQEQIIIPEIRNMAEYINCSSVKKKPVRDWLFQNISIIDDFISEKPNHLTASELEIIRSWKHFLSGEFIIERQLNKHAIFIKGNKVYAVLALQDSFFDILGGWPTPIYVKTVLLPFKGQIIYDGFLERFGISFGGGIKTNLKDTYIAAKDRGLIITDLLSPIQPVLKPAKNHYNKDFLKLIDELREMSKKLDQPEGNEPESKLVVELLKASIAFSSQMIFGSEDFSSARKKYMKLNRAIDKWSHLFDY